VEDEAEWRRDIQDEMDEIQEELADAYTHSMDEFNKQLLRWKQQKINKVGIN